MILNTYLDEIRKTPDLLIQGGQLLRRYPAKDTRTIKIFGRERQVSSDLFTLLPYGVANRIVGHDVNPDEYRELYGENGMLFLFAAALSNYDYLPPTIGGVMRITHARKLMETAMVFDG